MIRVEALYRAGRLVRLEAKGHAGSGPKGHDLVCAALSGILPGAFNALEGSYRTLVSPGHVLLEAPEGLDSEHDEAVMHCVTEEIRGIMEASPSHLVLVRKEMP